MSRNETPHATRLNERVYRLVSALLVSVMLVCALFTLLQFSWMAFALRAPPFLPAVVFLLALERFFMHPVYRRSARRQQERSLLLLPYWLAILLLLKFMTMLSHGVPAFAAELLRWQEDFLPAFFTLDYVGVLIICLMVWMVSGAFADLFDEMNLERALLDRDYGVDRSEHEQPAPERLQKLVFSLGAVLVVLTALSRLDVRAILTLQSGDPITPLPWLAGGGVSTLLYFMFSFALLSLTKFINLYTRWRLEGVTVSPSIAGRWAWYSLIFLAFLAIMVSLLPTHYSMGFITFLHWLFSLLIAFVIFITGLFWTLLMLPIMALLSLFGSAPSEGLPSLAQTPITPSLPQPDTTAALPAWELIKPYLFWGLFLVVAIYALRHYLLQHEGLMHAVQQAPLGRWLQQVRRWLAALFRKVNHQLAGLVTAGLERVRTAAGITTQGGGQDRFASLWRLNPRQQIHFYYHALLRGGDEGGLPRKRSQTPSEYAAMLAQTLPETDQEIDIITKSFMRARYTPQEISQGDVSLVKVQWRRLRKAFRHRLERKRQ